MRLRTPASNNIGAGVGYWAYLLREAGAEVHAFDSAPPAATHGAATAQTKINTYHGDCPSIARVEAGSPRVLTHARWRSHTLLLCYPPPRSSMAARSLSAYGGDTVIHVGEWLGDTGDITFERQLAAEWQLTERLPLPCWGDTVEDLTVWKRRKVKASSTAHPVLACDACGRMGSLSLPKARNQPGLLRRCRYCRLACYCSARCARAGSDAHALYHSLKMIEFGRELDFEGVDYHTICCEQ